MLRGLLPITSAWVFSTTGHTIRPITVPEIYTSRHATGLFYLHTGCDIKAFHYLSGGQVAHKIYLSGQQLNLPSVSGLLVHTKIDNRSKTKLMIRCFNWKSIYSVTDQGHMIAWFFPLGATIFEGAVWKSPTPVHHLNITWTKNSLSVSLSSDASHKTSNCRKCILFTALLAISNCRKYD